MTGYTEFGLLILIFDKKGKLFHIMSILQFGKYHKIKKKCELVFITAETEKDHGHLGRKVKYFRICGLCCVLKFKLYITPGCIIL